MQKGMLGKDVDIIADSMYLLRLRQERDIYGCVCIYNLHLFNKRLIYMCANFPM